MKIHTAWLQILAGMAKPQNWFSRNNQRQIKCIEDAQVVGVEVGKHGLVIKVSNGGTKPQAVHWLMSQAEAIHLADNYTRVAPLLRAAA